MPATLGSLRFNAPLFSPNPSYGTPAKGDGGLMEGIEQKFPVPGT
jgi:hypothetical protein